MTTVPPHADNGNIPTEPGIYKITCTVNGKIYLGSSINLRKRKSEHFRYLQHNKHHNSHLQRAWNKYGEDAFTFEVLELVLVPELLTAQEQYWFKKLKPFGRKGFNIARVAGSTLGTKRSPEAIENVRQALLRPEVRKKISDASRGRKQSPETIEKSRQARIGYKQTPEHIEKARLTRIGKKFSPERNKKISQAKLGKKNSPEHIEHMRQANLGKKQSAETIEKRRQAHLGSKRSPETRERMRLANLARWARLKKEQST